MKRFLPLLLLLFAPLAWAQSDPLNLAYIPAMDTNCANSQYNANAWMTDWNTKLRQDLGTNPGSACTLTVRGTQNEFVDFQVHWHDSGSGTAGLKITVGNFVQTAPASSTISSATGKGELVNVYREAYLNVTIKSNTGYNYYNATGFYPDILIPTVDPYWGQTTNAWPFTVAAGKNQSAWVDVLIPPAAPSGYYLGSVTVQTGCPGSCVTVATMPVTIAVWQWPAAQGGQMPSKTTSTNMMATSSWAYNGLCIPMYSGVGNGAVACGSYPGAGGSTDTANSLIYLDGDLLLADHRYSYGGAENMYPNTGSFSGYNTLVGPTMNGTCNLHNGAATTCSILTTPKSSTKLMAWTGGSPSAAIWNNWQTNFDTQGWGTAGNPPLYDYLYDEPSGAAWTTVVTNGNARHAYTMTSGVGIPELVTADLVTATANGAQNAIDWMVVNTTSLEPPAGQGNLQNLTSYQTWLTGSVANIPRHFLTYESCSQSGSCGNGTVGNPAVTYPAYVIDSKPASNRANPWLTFLHGATGELYYIADNCDHNGCGYPTTTHDAWVSIYSYGNWGDGTFVYTGGVTAGFPNYMGTGVTIPLILPSIRLKLARDGMQDYEYLNAMKVAGKGSYAIGQIASSTSASYANAQGLNVAPGTGWITNSYTFDATGTGLNISRTNLGNKLHSISFPGAASGPNFVNYTNFENSTSGTTLTPTILNAGMVVNTGGGGGTWTMVTTGSSTAMTVASAGQHNLLTPITAGGSTYSPQGTLGIQFDSSACSSPCEYGQYAWPTTSSNASSGFWFMTTKAPATSGEYSMGGLNSGADFVNIVVTNAQMYLEAQVNPNGANDNGAPFFNYAANTWYWISMRFEDGAQTTPTHTAMMSLAIYDASGNLLSFQQKASRTAASGHPNKFLMGRVGDVGLGPGLFYWDSLLVDTTGLIFPILPNHNYAPYAGIVDPLRAIDWSANNAGTTIPVRNTVCYTANPATETTISINAAITSCAANGVVAFPAGTYNIAPSISKSNVTLRGTGTTANSVIFKPSVANGCDGTWKGVICVLGSTNGYNGPGIVLGGTQSATVAGIGSGLLMPGQNQLRLTNVGSTGITNGKYIVIDQNNNAGVGADLFICDDKTTPCSLESGAPGRCSNGQSWATNGGNCYTGGAVARNLQQIVQVTSGCASTCTGAGPFPVTITPGLYAPIWSSTFSPAAWWPSAQITGIGIENLTTDASLISTANNVITFKNTFNDWMSNVASLNAPAPAGQNGAHVVLTQAGHITVQNSYMFGSQNNDYGVECFICGDNLIVNNIFQQVTVPIMMGPSQGNVYAHNFSINAPYPPQASWMELALFGGHDAGVLYNLFEDNQMNGVMGDVFHGTSGMNTYFRDQFVGWALGKTADTTPFQLYSYNRYNNVIGSVLGKSGYHINYQTQNGVGVNNTNAPIYDLGAGNTETGVTVPTDALVTSSLMRWGNYDTLNNAVRFVSAEVPSSLSIFNNPVPTQNLLPPSLYSTALPTWWPAAKVYPTAGPDVTGGNIPGISGFAYTNPAQDCYNALGGTSDGSGSALAFDASCTASSPTPTASLAPNPLPFGNQNINTTSSALLATFANTSSSLSVTITAINVTGNFSRSGGTCGTLPFTVLAGANCTIGITFSPTATIAYNGTLSVTDNATGSPRIINLTGQGTVPIITWASPQGGTTYNFGNVLLSNSANSAPLTLQNIGSGPLNVSLSSSDITHFSILSTTCGSTLLATPGSNTCTVTVRFTPVAATSYTANLIETDSNASNSPQSLALTGSGQTPVPNLVAPVPWILLGGN